MAFATFNTFLVYFFNFCYFSHSVSQSSSLSKQALVFSSMHHAVSVETFLRICVLNIC